MAKKKTLDQKIDHLTDLMEKGFGAVANDITDIKREMTEMKHEMRDMERGMATKELVLGIQTQVNSIERQLRETRTEMRLADGGKSFWASAPIALVWPSR